MPLPVPSLDDRTFDQLVEEAVQHIREHCPEWYDLPPGDPGRVLLEAFAYMTEAMLYRFNRLPEKAYVEFLKLIGTKLKPPSAARVRLVFTKHNETEAQVKIPKGSRVTSEAGLDAPTFLTEEALLIEPGETQVSGYATHGQWIEAELAGISTGMPGFTVKAVHAPIPSVGSQKQDIRIGVEVDEEEIAATVITYEGKRYQLWEIVEQFKVTNDQRNICIIDRVSGLITFSPSLQMEDEEGLLSRLQHPVAAIPPVGKEIRLWYFSGGGEDGNVISGTLNVLKDPIPGISVVNPKAASGGRNQESLDNALQRGPIELYSLDRAITAQDFEQIALNCSRQIRRAKAFASTELWMHATPGSVEVVIVPYLQYKSAKEVSYARLEQSSTQEALSSVQDTLQQRCPMGIHSKVAWVRYKAVGVQAKLTAHGYENTETTKARLLNRLYELISPLPNRNRSGLLFGESLHISSVYEVLLSDPGVRFVDELSLITNDVPSCESTEIAADFFQPNTWYTNREGKLFRSLDSGKGWELIAHFEGEIISGIHPDPEQAGSIAVVTDLTSNNKIVSRLYFTEDCGESWLQNAGRYTLHTRIRDACWLMRESLPVLMLATDSGLYELERRADTAPTPLRVGELDDVQGFYAVSASRYGNGVTFVVVAPMNEKGVYLSREGGTSDSYEFIGCAGLDVRVLTIQQEGRCLIWAGMAFAGGGQEQQGCYRIELPANGVVNTEWQLFSNGWKGGSCKSLSFAGTRVYAATYDAGLLVLNTGNPEFKWESPRINDGLPLRDQPTPQFENINAVAVTQVGDLRQVMVVTKEKGVFYSKDYGAKFESASQAAFANTVTLPATWLFCSGVHELKVVAEHERR